MKNKDIYLPFIRYDREIYSKPSSYRQYQSECANYDDSGKACAVPYEIAAPFLKTAIDWMWFLLDAPAEYHRCDFSKFSGLELFYLLRERVEFSLVVPWQQMAPEYRNLLLAYHPELVQNLSELQELSGTHWQKILQVKPKYSIFCPWQKLSGDNFQVIVEEHPELAKYCDFSKLSVENWLGLLEKQIRFLCFCPPAVRKNFSDAEKNKLFIIYPEIKEIF